MIAVCLSGIAFLCGIALGRALESEDTKEWMRITKVFERQLDEYRKELWFYTKKGGGEP